MGFTTHPVWRVGFRPFFLLACLAGMLLPPLWALIFAGVMAPPDSPVPPVQWHAHEMFYGFGWAMLAGFLLTASKNWVGIRGYHGAPLAYLAAAWLVDRTVMAFGGSWPGWLQAACSQLFIVAAAAMLMATLVRHRRSDSYDDNHFFLVALAAFPFAKALMLDAGHFQAGVAMTVALFRVAFLIMLERTLTQFMKNALQTEILRRPWLDTTIKSLALVLAAAPWLPRPLAIGGALLLALLLAGRLAFWQPQRALRRLDLGIMILGYAAIIAHLCLEAVDALVHPSWTGALTVHVFTLGVMGLIVPAMIVRIAKGHTGRKVVFEPADKAALWIMLGAFLVRVVAPQMLPGAYSAWITLAAAGWASAFAILAWRFAPYLLQPRIDGKEH